MGLGDAALAFQTRLTQRSIHNTNDLAFAATCKPAQL
jgi:hypothetical protein